ncbi:MAG: hypothetical protein ACTS73_06400 [Arsenophonus sp. NEOnobi-MAG3]
MLSSVLLQQILKAGNFNNINPIFITSQGVSWQKNILNSKKHC